MPIAEALRRKRAELGLHVGRHNKLIFFHTVLILRTTLRLRPCYRFKSDRRK